MNKQIEILHFIGHFAYGGAESLVISYYEFMNHDNIHFDYVTREKNDKVLYSKVSAMGSKIFETSKFPLHTIKNIQEVKKILSENSYDIIHVHANSLLYLVPLIVAKRYGIKIRIIHSHNSKPAKHVYEILHHINKKFINKLSTNKIACSELAGKWMFSNDDYLLINNAIDINKYYYNIEYRNEIRQKLNINNDCFTIGNIGRLVNQKNQMRTILIFEELLKYKKNAKLIIIGNGELKDELKKLINEKNLNDKVIVLDPTHEVEKYYSCFDCLLMTSFYEGLPFTLVEAQANGLPCIVSDTVSENANMLNNFSFASLDNSNKIWIDKILNSERIQERSDINKSISTAGYNIQIESKKMETLYEKLYYQK